MAKVIIGLVGENGAGKGTFGKILKKLTSRYKIKIETIRFSDPLREILDILGLPDTRSNLQFLAIALRNQFSEDYLPNALKHRISQSKANIIILDGVRWLADEKFIRSMKHSSLIYVTAQPKIRHKRLAKRGEKSGEKGLSFNQFMIESQRENEIHIPDIGSRADHKIANDGKEIDFSNQIFFKIIPWLKAMGVIS